MRQGFGIIALALGFIACGDRELGDAADDPASGGSGGTSTGGTGNDGGTGNAGADGGAGNGGGDGGSGGAPLTTPEIAAIKATPTDNALRINVTFETDVDAEGWIVFGPTNTDDPHPVQTTRRTPVGQQHELVLYGMLEETDFFFEVHAQAEDGGLGTSSSIVVTTGTLPAELAGMNVTVATPEYDGFILTKQPVSTYDVIHDTLGRVVWYEDSPLSATPGGSYGVWPSGRYYSFGKRHLLVKDIDGTELFHIDRENGPGDIMHHGAEELANGNIAVMTAYTGEAPNDDLVGDGIDVIDPSTGEVVWQWDIFDHIDPGTLSSIGGTFWQNDLVGDDWSHGNSLAVDANGDYYLSLRHIDLIAKVDGTTGDLLWLLGEQSDDFVAGPGASFLRQHAAFPRPDGTLAIFNNGDGTVFPESVALELELDEVNGTANVAWSYDVGAFCTITSSSYLLANGNRLITCGPGGRVLEVTGDSKEVVWEARLENVGLVFRFIPVQSLNPVPTLPLPAGSK